MCDCLCVCMQVLFARESERSEEKFRRLVVASPPTFRAPRCGEFFNKYCCVGAEEFFAYRGTTRGRAGECISFCEDSSFYFLFFILFFSPSIFVIPRIDAAAASRCNVNLTTDSLFVHLFLRCYLRSVLMQIMV